MAELLTEDQLTGALAADLTAWSRQEKSIIRSVQADSFSDGIRLVEQVAVVAEAMNHHPDIDIRWTTVTFRLSTHSAGGVTAYDLRLAAEIDRLTGPPG
ncbi:MAG: Pterin-4-alpha-carbinolamine dehydratase [uncultured Nocardioidaceae bacterium]|uniref:Putative pterin-4-alpha-carbinolamine dehydratase n=1 Tax=uncultured Nocardioidaceae bacterium TaxID=253824 RepID=A0A6J4NDQ7_9ACTN|nr:MAG: Pterin-4-alpha-carbinolamine dehydratase [uncultured Nocardioidaceae bacterium]